MTTKLPTPAAEAFPLSDVQLKGGPFLDANKRCAEYLLTVDPDRLLCNFRKNSGLQPKGKLYGGWEDSGLAGHSLGHYLSACAQEYAVSKDPRYKAKVEYIVNDLVECQKSRPDGFIAATPEGDKIWKEVKAGQINTAGFALNGLWSPWYTHHKVFAGLLDAYHLVGNKPALRVAEKFADWAIDTTSTLTPELWEKMLHCEYGGMNDSMAELYSITKQQKYLDLSHKFYDHLVLDPLAEGKDSLPGKHSNTQIPKIIGLARLYELTGDPKDEKIANVFWDTVVHHHSYAIGGNSNHEYLGPADKLSDALSSNTCETCNTYNMLKLTRHLFEWDPKAEYADYYERAHLNHILASQDPETAMMTYFMPLGSGSERQYSNPFDDWTCCHGSGMENHTKHADSVYFHSGNQKLWVNLYIPSELKWGSTHILQETKFPNDGHVTLTVSGGSKKFEMAIRHPYWATQPVEVKVNGKVALTSTKPSSYMLLDRNWKAGDKVEVNLPMSLHTEAMPDNDKRVAILYGPVVLAADLAPRNSEMPRTPVLVTSDTPVDEWLERVPGPELAFKTKGVGRPADLTFKPFYTLHKDRYAVYFDEFTTAQWDAAEAEYRAEEARVRDLEARTTDYFRIGEMQPERDHDLKSEKNDVREANGRGFRTPLDGGWMTFEMKVDPATASELVITYWGNERSRPEFDILVDGQMVSTEKLAGKPANKFYDINYVIPVELTKGKSKVTVKIQAHEHRQGGSLTGARTVKAKV